MLHRIVLAVPALAFLLATSLIFMSARAPRTWAAHWSRPAAVARAQGADEYGVVPNESGGWDLLWVDGDTQHLVFSSTGSSTGGRSRSIVLDPGQAVEPTLLRAGGLDEAAWIHQRNGGSDLYMALLRADGRRSVARILFGSQPMENPQLFAGPHGAVDLVFSWQRYGNFDVFLVSLQAGALKPRLVKRLTVARFYSFYPRAATDGEGNIGLLHLESCCSQEGWNITFDRFGPDGRRLSPSRVFSQVPGVGTASSAPSQWGEDIHADERGNLWGAFASSDGTYIFEAGKDGSILRRPSPVEVGTVPNALSLLLTATGGYLFWEQPFDLGTYLDSRRFDSTIRPLGQPERVVYEGASQTNPHAFLQRDNPVVIWQAVTRGLTSNFETASYRADVPPTLAQRLGLGLGDPWGQLAILIVSSFGVAVLTTVLNILTVFGLAIVGLGAARVLRRVPGRWAGCALLVTAGLYLTFVAPGTPTLFLDTIPSMGLAVVPFGLLAAGGALGFVLWLGGVALRRVEDLYRVGLMAVLGVYFFAFVEAVIVIQQRIAYI